MRAMLMLGLLMLLPVSARAQDLVVPSAQAASTCDPGQTQWLRDRPLFDPIVADIRAPQIAFNFPMLSPAFPHSVKDGTRVAWDVSVGKEIAIFNRANYTEATQRTGCSGWGLWVDLSFHVIEELGKDESNPIIDTDYRFSLVKLKYSRFIKVNPDKSFESLAFKADLLHHESTHLGDEYVLHAQTLPADLLAARGERPFERFNPSFEFFDVAVGYNWGTAMGQLITIRGGTTAPEPWEWGPGKGLYSDHTLEPNGREVISSKRKFEPYAQFEYHQAHDAVSESGLSIRQRFRPFVSVDARHRIVYNFYKTSFDQNEEKQLSVNALAGVRTWSGFGRFSIKEIYLRYYYGVNPAGQLRSQKDYWLFGTGVTFATGDR
jgi:hypothetical protein